MPSKNPIENLGESLGDYLREQRKNARLSLRQLADLAGVSNPYLSQIERGIKKPSAEILQQLAKGLQISSESLYVKAGFLDERAVSEHRPWDVEAAITADVSLTERQKSTLIDIYRSFVGEPTPSRAESPEPPAAVAKRSVPTKRAPRAATASKAAGKAASKARARKATATKATASKSTASKATTTRKTTTTDLTK